MRYKHFIIKILALFLTVHISYAQSITLTPQNYHCRVDKAGTVTFQYTNDLHVEKARKEGLRNIYGLTFTSAIIYDVAFSKGYVSSYGKIFNYTSNPIKITCSYYSNEKFVTSYVTKVEPRTFMRMIPNGKLSTVRSCNKIICSEESRISIGHVSNSPKERLRASLPNTSITGKLYFPKESVFYAQSNKAKQTVTYYTNGTCYCIGYILSEGYWVKGTSNGRYYIQNGIIHVIWDSWLNESYRLSNNSYKNDDLLFRLQK